MNTAPLIRSNRFAPVPPLVRAAAAIGRRAENTLAAVSFLALGLLPCIELVLRTAFGTGIPGNAVYIANLTLWVGFGGAMIASRENGHLSLAVGLGGLVSRIGLNPRVMSAALSSAVAAGLTWSALQFVASGISAPTLIDDWLPEWIIFTILPLCYAVATARFVASVDGWAARVIAVLTILTGAATAAFAASAATGLLVPGLLLLLAAAALGAPLFVLLGGAALLLFFADGVPAGAIMAETYRMVVSPAVATVPLFTLTGYLLAEGRTTERMVRLFRAWFGWMPGGLAVISVLVCAFFSSFTGVSGVTILALGGLLLPVLVRNGYPESFSVGLLTATGSIGLLFPPSLAVIIYGVVAGVPIPDVFIAGILPGLAMVGCVCLYSLRVGVAAEARQPPFELREALAALWGAKWEILLPVVALAGIFSGRCTLAEAAAITVAYALVLQTLIHRDIDLRADLPRILVRCAAMIGGIFIILGAAMGLTSYLVDAEIPAAAATAVRQLIASPAVFLLALNVLLLIVGCLMDIFSATAVVLPLIIPISAAYGIHPLHLAMIFLTNLELGYLTPPVGLNLFLASYRFERTIPQVCRSTWPFLLLLGIVVLVVTYAPLLGFVPAWRLP
jgi:tripartite ATP-independent transporter DctM subunit